jgi:hypothetical protein
MEVRSMEEDLSAISEAIKKASEAFVEAISAVSKTIQGAAAKPAGPDRDRLVENWLRIARMSKDGVITAVEHGFEIWERQVRRMTAAAGSGAKASSDPMEAWTENLRKATESFISGGASLGEEARKQAEAVQKTMTEGIRAWQRLWEPPRK